jgi:hypothetical protein
VVWWAQGDLGPAASPGGWLRLLGKDFAPARQTATGGGASVPTSAVSVLLRAGERSTLLKGETDGYSAKVALPADLLPGEYKAFVHNGFGGNAAWGEPMTVTVAKATAWPQAVLNVKDLGADPTGQGDSTPALRQALEQAKDGGVVFLPRGRYQVTDGLALPPRTVLRGEGREVTCLFWPDTPKPPEALIRGSHSFAVEDLTLYASNHVNVIAADQTTPEAGNVFLRRLRVRADMYRGHLKPEEVNERFVTALRSSTGGGDTVRLGGRNVVVTDCDLYGSGRALYLSGVRGGLIASNTFYNGRWGWYCLSGSDGLVFERNAIVGADLMATGGGLNCLDGSTCSQNVYYAHNTLSLMHGWDREAMTSDAGGGPYFGGVASVDGAKTTLAEDPQTENRSWAGAAMFILGGRGRGQYRRVVSIDGRVVELDSPWVVAPDGSSTVTVTMLQRRYLFVGNSFSDAGVALQLYGMALEHIADGNVSTRTAGFHNFGMRYGGIQPSWYIQWLNNTIREGNSYRSGHDNYLLSGEAHLGIFALPPSVDFKYPLTLGCVARGNRLENNAHIAVGGSDPYNPAYANPTVQEVIVENNEVADSDVGLFLRRAAAGVLVRGNRFTRVKEEIRDEVAMLKVAEERRRKLLQQKGPLALWDFEKATAATVPDASGNGFAATVNGTVTLVDGHTGKGAQFAGESFLRVDEPAMFNLQDATLSLWLKPDTMKGRHGLIGKRFAGTAAPFVVSLWDGGIEFEATDTEGNWSFNFRSSPAVREGEWNHVAVVIRQGKGVTLYVDGAQVAEKENALDRVSNAEPLILGREAWAGVNMVHEPCFFQGVLDEVKVWGRALSAEEVAAEAAK